MPRDPELAERFGFGVLDLARKVCTAENPRCEVCPLRNLCEWFAGLKKA